MRLWDLVLNAEIGTQFILCDLKFEHDWDNQTITIETITDDMKYLEIIFFKIVDINTIKVYCQEPEAK